MGLGKHVPDRYLGPRGRIGSSLALRVLPFRV